MRNVDLFKVKVKFGTLGSSIGKVKTVDFFSETFAASGLKVCGSSHLIEYMKVCEYWPKVVYIQKFKPDFLRNYFADLNQFL